MIKRFFGALIVFSLIGTPLLTFAAEFRFYRDLKQGDKLFDVFELQKILNTSPDTVVAQTGAGSAGNETDYFGVLTNAAVIRFQNKYKNEILTPIGLNYGTGFVGVSTRNILNSIFLEEKTSSSTHDVIEVSSSTININNNDVGSSTVMMSPFIDYISNINVSKGDVLTVYGSGFSSSSVVYIDTLKVENPRINPEAGQISFTVPSQNGVHLLSVENNFGDSRFITPIYFVVSNTVVVKSKTTKADSSNIDDVENVLKLMGV